MDDDVKELIQRLGKAINETMAESETIRGLLREIEERGFSLTISLGVMVGSTEEKRRRRPARSAEEKDGEERRPRPSAFDRKFLKALRIRLTEEQT